MTTPQLTDEQLHELENWVTHLYQLEKEISDTFMDYHPLPKVLTRPHEIPALFKRFQRWQLLAERRLDQARGLPGRPLTGLGPVETP